jgi:SdpC family antimicrobial peptide
MSTNVFSNTNFSGEEIYKGVFFLDGEVANLIPEYEGIRLADVVSAEVISKYQAKENKVIEIIKSNNPTFFEEFKNDMTSGNHIQVQNAIKRGVEILKNTLEKDNKLNEKYQGLKKYFEDNHIDLTNANAVKEASIAYSKTVTSEDPDVCCGGVVAVCIGAVAVAVIIAVTVAFWVEGIDNGGDPIGIGSENLYGEEIVNSIANNLKAA